jgi:hypothetical protein
VLFFGLVQVTVDHLKYGVLRVDLSVVILLIDLNLFLELLGLSNSHNLSPVSENFHTVEVGHLLLLIHRVLKVVTTHLQLLLLLVKVLNTFILMSNFDESAFLISRRGSLTLHELA